MTPKETDGNLLIAAPYRKRDACGLFIKCVTLSLHDLCAVLPLLRFLWENRIDWDRTKNAKRKEVNDYF